MKNATACFLRQEDKTLFLYRNGGKDDLHNGFYVPPGGHIEKGERGIEGVIREFREETGLLLLDPRLKVILTCNNKGRLLGGRTDRDDFLVQVYVANGYYGDLKEESGKNAKPIWISDDSISEIKMYPGDKRLLELLDKDGVFEAKQKYCGENLLRFDVIRVD